VTTTEEFTVRLYDALVATLVREGNAIDDTRVGQCCAAIQAITPLLGELIGETARDPQAVDLIVEQINKKIHRIASEVIANRGDQKLPSDPRALFSPWRPKAQP
jgi:hypothetical protein